MLNNPSIDKMADFINGKITVILWEQMPERKYLPHQNWLNVTYLVPKHFILLYQSPQVVLQVLEFILSFLSKSLCAHTILKKSIFYYQQAD